MAPIAAVPQSLGLRPVHESSAVTSLQVFCVVLFLFPSDSVISVLGADGFVGGIVGVLAFFGWLVSALFGFHDPRPLRTPARTVLLFLWLASITAYVPMPFHDLTVSQRASGDRWMLLLVGVTGVALLAAERLHTLHDVMLVVRVFIYGAAFSALVAVLQFWAGVSLVPYIRSVLPGFVQNGAAFEFQARGTFERVAGTATHPIELGVVSGMLIPLAAWSAVYDRNRKPLLRFLPPVLLAGAVAATVSRSAVLALLIAGVVFVVVLPASQRVWGLAITPLGVTAIFMTAPGFIRTLLNSATAGDSDPSLANRTNNYPYVEALVREHPWFGTGGGTYIAADALRIFDNEYLTTAVSLGLVGTLAVVWFFFAPAVCALAARRRTAEPSLRALLGALAGGGLAAAVCSGTFDSLSFPMFTYTYAVLLGLIGAAWLIARAPVVDHTEVSEIR